MVFHPEQTQHMVYNVFVGRYILMTRNVHMF